MVVKDNQHHLYAAIDLLFTDPPPDLRPAEMSHSISKDKGHGRLEQRTVHSSTLLSTYLDWPGACQVRKRTRRSTHRTTGQTSQHVTYAVTSLSPRKAAPKQLAALWRNHWTIENRLHYVRDETFGEDRGHKHTGSAPHALAILRHAVLNCLRHQGWLHIPRALRHYAASVPRILSLLGVPAT